MAHLSRTKLARAIITLMEKHPKKDVVNTAAKLIKGYRMEREIDALIHAIGVEMYNRHRHLDMSVTSAHPLSPKTATAIKELFTAKYQAKSIVTSKHIDSRLLGGVIVSTPVGELDVSIKNKLNQLKTKMS